MKSDVRTFSGGGGGGGFSVHMFACKDENIRFFNLHVYCMGSQMGKPRKDVKNEPFPDFEGLICKEKLEIHIWLDCICTRALHCFPLGSYLQHPLALQPRGKEHYAVAQIVSFFGVFSVVLLI